MPVIVVGADGPFGAAVVEALQPADREVRAFVSDPAVGEVLRDAGVRTAVGDAFDGSHVEWAAAGAHTAVLLADATRSPATLAAWGDAVADAGVARVIWVGTRPEGGREAPESAEVATAGRAPADVAVEVADLDDRPRLGG